MVALMDIRLGYAAIALGLQGGSPNRTLREASLAALGDAEGRLLRLQRLARENLKTTLRILRYNAALGINLYRLSSRLVPFATHPLWAWDWERTLEDEFQALTQELSTHPARLTVHLDHFAVLNSPKEDVRLRAVEELRLQARILRRLGGEAPVLVTHVGSRQPDRLQAMARFLATVEELGDERSLLAIENDDTRFDADDVLELADRTGCPAVFDWHHHRLLRGGGRTGDLIRRAASTWSHRGRPLFHISNPREKDTPRAHADGVSRDNFLAFLRHIRPLDQDVDVMLEAKGKDLAVKALLKDLQDAADVVLPGGARVRLQPL